MCGRKGLERFVKGYRSVVRVGTRLYRMAFRQIRRDLDKKREELNTQNPSQYSISENLIKVEFYKPVVGSRLVNSISDLENLFLFSPRTRKVGGLYRSNTVGRIGFFMHH